MCIKTKYGFDLPQESFDSNIGRLTNQLWKILPMREHGEDWNKQLSTVLVEIVGLHKICIAIPQFLQLISKLEGLLTTGESIPFEVYRKIVFESISLLQRLKNVRDIED